MSSDTVTVRVSNAIYRRLEARAQSVSQPVDTVVAQTLEQGLAHQADEHLPPTIRAELDAMGRLSDDVLWGILRSVVNDDSRALYDLLLERKQTGTLTPEGEHWLRQVAHAADALMLRKAHAAVLLQQRGHRIPSIDELPRVAA